MKMLVKILVVIVIIVGVVLIMALFVNKHYTIQREITVNKPKQEVFNYIKHLKNQDNFSKWVMQDPGMKKDFKGTDGTIGFVYAWDSQDKNAGKGEQEIVNIKEGEKLDVEVRFEKPFAGVAHTPFATEAVSENQTKVTWGMTGENPYPRNIMNLFMDKMMGKDIEASLTNLKGILEKS
ncbi:SRPBCC family protein [Segetibacter aerophilus]|uniref:Polyketide cyclase n=1 Tax=Segetibacter aerophilus TaxID=670293 RepID=A0A512BB86_9BACT|nr:SRPBCC family protein [Segetibacter aerophilus]GEO09087.1 polyketide cyclase [Segetibacter aerophilus]